MFKKLVDSSKKRVAALAGASLLGLSAFAEGEGSIVTTKVDTALESWVTAVKTTMEGWIDKISPLTAVAVVTILFFLAWKFFRRASNKTT